MAREIPSQQAKRAGRKANIAAWNENIKI